MNILTKARKAFREGGMSLLVTRALYKLRTFFHPRDTFILWEFYHELPKGLPTVEWSVRPVALPTSADVHLAGRILNAFTLAMAHEKKYRKTGEGNSEDVWDAIKKNRYSDFNVAFSSGDPRTVAEYLCNYNRLGLAHGISDFNEEQLHTDGPRLGREKMALIKDHMVSLAEAVGVRPYGGPYGGRGGPDTIYEDADQLVKDIKERIGIDITPPDIDGGLVKVRMDGGHFSPQDIWAIYTAWRIGQVVEKDSRICDIGAGIGKAALYAHRLGFSDYTTYDLPQVNVVQAWYLLKCLSEVSIQLYGEPAPIQNAIKILPYWEFSGNTKFDVVINIDSFPEIAKEIVVDYIKKIRHCTSYFLSINREDEGSYGIIHGPTTGRLLSVPRVIDTVSGFRRVHRFPFWLQRGYVEELYKTLP